MIMEESDPRHLLVKIAKILEGLKIPYLVTGGIAVLLWGRPRFTADIDIVVNLQPENIEDLTSALKELKGYADEDEMKHALEKKDEFNFIDPNSGIKIDFWILKNDEFDASRLKRRVSREIMGQKIYFTSPEDLILIKLIWYKESSSSRHLEDIESILKISGDKIDRIYIQEWAAKLSVSKIWEDYPQNNF